jgi:formylglycine-generating enzyme required for sulfatase activity/serine/threonine protein kinase
LGVPEIPDHELIRSIGRGAYGEIWLATTLTGAFRAVKVLSPDPETSYREFDGLRTFEPISRHHAGFVNIYHVGRGNGFLYYTMELADDSVGGQKIDPLNYRPRTLASDLQGDQRLSAERCLQLGIVLGEALSYMHERNLTHRDIKPSNVIFVNGQPKLADIGLVAAAGRQTYVGTEGYVPPEGPGSPDADVYALGKVLYEAATGKDRLDFPEIPTNLPDRPDKEKLVALNSVLLKACARTPKQRFASAGEFVQALRSIDGRPVPKLPKRGCRSLALIGGFVAAAALALFSLPWWVHAPQPNPASTPASTAIPVSTPVPAVTQFPTPEAPKTGVAEIKSNPPGAQVWDGDKLLGETPIQLSKAPVGPIRLQLRLPRYLYAEVTGQVEADQTLFLAQDLQIAKAPVSGRAWTNTIAMRFVPVGDLLFAIWDTRVRDFEEFVRASSYQVTGPMESILDGMQGQHGKTWDYPGFSQTPDHPVVGVSWKDAMEFCSWLTQKERGIGLLQEGQYYRLPTDQEWSQAAGIEREEGTTPEERSGHPLDLYPWGNSFPPPAGAGNYAGSEMRGADWPANWRFIQNYDDGFTRTSPVGSFKPNAFGIYDLGGNVWQWCMDKFSANGDSRVLRGASWANADPALLKTNRRIDAVVDNRTDCYGFRCVLQTPVYGIVTVQSEPKDATVILNGKEIGRTPLVLENVKPGPAKFEIRLSGYKTEFIDRNIEARQDLDLPLLKLVPVQWPVRDRTWTNSLGMRFVPVDRMLVAVWDTRVSDFRSYCRAVNRGMPVPGFAQTEDDPVVLINRSDAEAFCSWLTQKEREEGLIRSHDQYQLPTDLEWSRFTGLEGEQGESPAARDSRDQKHYPWGELWPPPADVGNLGNPPDQRNVKRRFARTSPVGSFSPNQFGIYDFTGNVWQWCSDPYGGSSTFANFGVLRGGSWNTYGVRLLLTSYRNVVAPGDRDPTYGFRCVFEVGE